MKIINEIIAFWKADKWSKWVIMVSMLLFAMIIDNTGSLRAFNDVWGYILQKTLIIFGTTGFLVTVFYKGIYDFTIPITYQIYGIYW